MREISLSQKFPSEATMLAVLKKTIEQSWKVDLDIEDIEIWLRNFTGRIFDVEIERRLALWMLCNFTYYNEEEVNHGRDSICSYGLLLQVVPVSVLP